MLNAVNNSTSYTTLTNSTSANSISLQARAKSTCMALDAIYTNSINTNTNKKIALVEKLLDAGFGINGDIEANGKVRRLLDVAIEQADRAFAENLVRTHQANPHLCLEANQRAYFMDELKSVYARFGQPDLEMGLDHEPSFSVHIQNNDGSVNAPTNERDNSLVPTLHAVYVPDAVRIEEEPAFTGTIPLFGYSEYRPNFFSSGATGVRGAGDSLRSVDSLPTNAGRVTTITETEVPLFSCALFCCAGVSVIAAFVGLESALNAGVGSIGAAILHNWYKSYDPTEAAQMGALGGAVIAGGAVALGCCIALCCVCCGSSGAKEGAVGTTIGCGVAGILITGLVGYGIMNDGNSATDMNIGQTAAAFAVGDAAIVGAISGGIFALACLMVSAGCIGLCCRLVCCTDD